jgi:predicted  nucleic acid-binding Zn-ribbon protein
MAIRMQQRRGTAEQWTDANPILAAGEIGFETDTGQFKIGDGVNQWEDLAYFKNLDDLGANLDDYILITEKGAVNGVATLDGTGKIPLAQLPDQDALDAEVDAAIVAHSSDTDPHGDRAYTDAEIVDALATASADATSKANAAQAAAEATASADATSKANAALADANEYTDDAIEALDTSLKNYADAAEVDAKGYTDAREAAITSAYQSYADTAEADAISAAAADATTKANTAEGNAISTASADATAKANQALLDAKDYTDGRETAITSAYQLYANQAEIDAVATAAADATAKANQAESNAITTANAYTDAREVVIKSHAETYALNAATNAVAQTIDAAPETLNTLNELAAALGDDPNFATTVTNSLSSKAPLASPELTGTPTAPTPTSGDSTNKIATTSFVSNAISPVQSDLSVAEANITTLQSDLDIAEADIDTAQADIDAAEANIATLQSDLDIAEADISAIESNVSTLQSGLSSVQADVSTAQTDINNLETDLNTAESNIATLQSTTTTHSGNITFLTGKVNTYGLDILNLQTDLDAAELDIDNIQTDVTAAETDITNLQTSVSSLQSSVSTLGTDLDAAEADISTLESGLSSAEADISLLETTVSGISTDLVAAESNISTLQTDLNAAEADIATLESTVSNISSDLNTAESNISTLQTDLNTAESNISTLQGDLDTAEATLATVVSDLDTHEAATTSVHGIANTADLATKSYADSAASNAQAAATNYVDAELVDYATKASPTFTGTVTLPSSTNIGDVTSTEIGYLDGVTSSIQTQLGTKSPSASPTFTGTVSLPATTSIGTVDATEISHLEGVTDNIQGQLSTKAPLSSPAFIGTPTAPTADAGTNTTQIATTAFVTEAVNDLIASAPGALDTLNELAAAIGDDANFASTVTTSLASKAPLASPTFTGTVTMPLSTAGYVKTSAAGLITSSSSVPQADVSNLTSDLALKAPLASPTFTGTVVLPSATSVGNVSSTEIGFLDGVTSAIQTQLNDKAPSASPTFTGTVALPATSSVTFNGTALSVTLDEKANKTAGISSKTAAYTFANGDVNMIFEYNSASAAAFTIPADNSFWPVGQRLEVLQVGSGQLTISGGSGVTVNGTPTTKTRTQWSGATIIKRAANTFVVVGDLASS